MLLVVWVAVSMIITRDIAGFSASVSTIASAARNMAAGNIVEVLLQRADSTDPTSVVDTDGNTYVLVRKDTFASNTNWIYYAWNIGGHAANIVTATWAGAAPYTGIVVYNVTPTAGYDFSVDPLVDSDQGSGSGTAIATASLTIPTTAFVGALILTNGSGTLTAGAGYTLAEHNTYFGDEYRTDAATSTVTATYSASGGWSIVAAAFQETAIGGGGGVDRRAAGYDGSSRSFIDSPAHADTAGALLIALWQHQATDTPTVTDTDGNTWTFIRKRTRGSNTVGMHYAYAIGGHATNVVRATWAGATIYTGITVLEVLPDVGFDWSVDPLVDSDEADGSSAVATVPSLTIPTTAFVAAIVQHDGTSDGMTGDSGFTLTNHDTYWSDQYKAGETSGTVIFTSVGNAAWAVVGAAFQQTATGGSASLSPSASQSPSASVSPSASASPSSSASPSPEPAPDVESPWIMEAEYAGRGNGWDTFNDVLIDDIVFRYGLMGNGPNDLVAGPGTLSAALDNSSRNEAGLLGYYSPHHVNKRAGFGDGIRVRLSAQVNASYPRRFKFVGTVDSIIPVAGAYGRRASLITVTDWMDYASMTKVSGLGIQLNKRSDELFVLLVESLPVQPSAIETEAGKDTYPFAFDNLQDESRTVLTELNRLAQSERGRIFIKGDTVQGGTLTFEPRGHRITTLTNVDTFEDAAELVGLHAPTDRSQVINRAQVITNQRRLGETDDEVLYDSEQRIALEPLSTITIFAPYRDPLAEAERIAAIDVQEPVSGTDFTATANEDGTGDVLTANVTVDVGDDGNGAHVEIENTGSTKAWLWFRILGRGLYTYRTTVLEDSDPTSIAVRGERTATINMPYQSNAAVANAVVRYTVRLFKNPTALPVAEFTVGYDEPDLLDRVLRREIGDRIGIAELVTGLDETTASPVVRGYFINAIECRIVQDSYIQMRWTLSPSDTTNYWRLGVQGSSNLGSALTAPGQIIGHGDQPHGDSAHVDVAHIDTAHADTAHADTAHLDHTDGAGAHQDTAHSDSAHIDTPHSDSAHQDTAHSDSAHVDTAHTDSAHGDQAHGDEPHIDESHADEGHADQAHGDTAYSDTAHQDEAHVDEAHVDDFDDIFEHSDHGDEAHGDEAHDDTAHVDTAHSDSAHQDSAHSDAAHGDEIFEDGPDHVDNAHGDAAHADTAHSDVHHVDAHGDAGHADTGHGDAAHVDHTDGSHGDSAHLDTAHVDTAHADTAHSDTAHLDAPHVDD